MSTTRTVAKAAGIMMAAILLSRILGLVREMVIANQFGGGGDVSAYRLAFVLPDSLYFLLSSGALSSAFIPVFTEYLTKGKEDEAWKVFSIIATFIFIVLGTAIILCEIFARPLVGLVALGFARQHPELLDITVRMTRIVLPSQIFFFMGGLIIASLYARQHFLAPAVGPIIYNIFIIAGGLFLAVIVGIAGLTWGALVGAFVGNFLLQLIAVRKIGVKFKPSLNLRHPGVVKVGKLALPVILGLSLPYVDVSVNYWFGAFLATGAVAALGFANRLMQVPLGVFGQAAAVALFPTLAAQAARKEIGQLRTSVNFGVRGIMLLTIPSSVLMAVLAMPIVTMLFRHGKFTPEEGSAAAVALVFYAIGIAGWAGQAVIARGFYALQDTIVPVVTGTVMTLIFIPLNWILMKPMGHAGLALATSIAAILNMLALLELFRRRLGGINGRLIAKSLAKVIVSSAAAGFVAWIIIRYAGTYVELGSALGALMGFIAASVPALVVYLGMIALLRVDEAAEVWKLVSRRFRRA
jgi:putative peptidoglycan lipid II flippase